MLHHRLLLFDLGGTIAAVCMFAMAGLVTLRHTAQLLPRGADRMNPLARWSRFNLVGVLGMAVQLVALFRCQPSAARALFLGLGRRARADPAA